MPDKSGDMKEINTCPSCSKDNPINMAICQFCGELLPLPPRALSTEPVPHHPADVTSIKPPTAIEVSELRGKGVALIVRGHQDPILIQGSDIVLGRYDPGAQLPTVDLTPYNAGALGVSRSHARLRIQEEVCLIEDLNSTNGTWVNQQRLPAGKTHGLASGDVIQLGQLMLQIYFDHAAAVRSVEERISFKTPAKLTPHFLATRISPYLTALAAVQAICDEVRGVDPSPIEINGISIEGPMIITVQITGAREALRLAKGSLKEWRQVNAGKLNQFLVVKEAVGKRTGLLMGEEGEQIATVTSDEAMALQLGRELREGEIRLAFEFLREIAPGFSGDDRKASTEKLISPLHVLAFSPLHVTTGSNSLAH
ncbi:MAG: hypothetical protein CL610_27590 [Anaerolineaceae bacterium]|nr:hypothetical protein [Anaerolineaceae bacterium]